MSKRQHGDPFRDRLLEFLRSLTLTHQEQAMVAAILLSLLTGALVMHYRREYRLAHPLPPPAVTRPAMSQGEASP